MADTIELTVLRNHIQTAPKCGMNMAKNIASVDPLTRMPTAANLGTSTINYIALAGLRSRMPTVLGTGMSMENFDPGVDPCRNHRRLFVQTHV